MPAHRYDKPVRTLTQAYGTPRQPCYITFIASGPYINIGTADDPHTRLRILQAANPTKLELTAYLPCSDRAAAQEVERLMHRHYADAHVNGKWFKLTQEAVHAHLDLLIGFTQSVVLDASRDAAEIERRDRTISQMKNALDRAYDILMRVRAGRKLTMREAYAVLAKNSRDAKGEILLGLSYHRFPDKLAEETVEDETQPVGELMAVE